MNPLYPSDAQAKAEILDAGRKIYQRGLVAANDGNLSVRVGGQRPVGYAHRRFKRRHDGGYAGQALSGRHGIGGDSEALFGDKNALAHLPGEPAVRAVVHAHPPAATAFAAAGLPLDRPVLQEAVVQLGTVPVAPFALPGSQAVADSVAPYCQAYRALLLEYHGAVTWGTSMEQAHYRLECLEQLATVTLHLRTLGIHRTMPGVSG